MKVGEGLFDSLRPEAPVCNRRRDPYACKDSHKANELAMRIGIAWGGQVRDLHGAHFSSLKECPPRPKGGTLGVAL